MIQPWPVTDVEIAFGKFPQEKLPTLKECFEMERAGTISRSSINLIDRWFYEGLKSLEATPKQGVEDDAAAMRCIAALLRSFEPKHEHKRLLCAWLLETWFTDISYE